MILLSRLLKEKTIELKNKINIVVGKNGVGKSYFFNNPYKNFFVIDESFTNDEINESAIQKNWLDLANSDYDEYVDFVWYKNNDKSKIYHFRRKIPDDHRLLINNRYHMGASNLYYWQISPWNDIVKYFPIKIIHIEELIREVVESYDDGIWIPYSYVKKSFHDEKTENSWLQVITDFNNFIHGKHLFFSRNDEYYRWELKIKNHTLNIEIPFKMSKLSFGEKKLLGFLIGIKLRVDVIRNVATRNFFIWDEIENGFHPEWQIKILNLLKKYINHRDKMICLTHSPTMIRKSYMDNKISIFKYSRISKSGSEITQLNLPKDDEIRKYFGLSYDEIESLKKLMGRKTLIVEGISDEIYLKNLLGTGIKIIVADGNTNGVKIQNLISITDSFNNDLLMLLDNDLKGGYISDSGSKVNYIDEFESGKYILNNKHFLPGLNWDQDIENYFVKEFEETDFFDYDGQKYVLITKNKIGKYSYTLNELSNEVIVGKIKKTVDKLGCVVSDKLSGLKIFSNENNLKIPSKRILAEWVVEENLNTKNIGLLSLVSSIKKYFELNNN